MAEPFEQQVREALLAQAGVVDDYHDFAHLIAPRIAAAIEAAINKHWPREEGRAAALAVLRDSDGGVDQIRALTDVVIALEDAKTVRLYAVPGGQCPYPSDVARALYERGVRASEPR